MQKEVQMSIIIEDALYDLQEIAREYDAEIRMTMVANHKEILLRTHNATVSLQNESPATLRFDKVRALRDKYYDLPFSLGGSIVIPECVEVDLVDYDLHDEMSNTFSTYEDYDIEYIDLYEYNEPKFTDTGSDLPKNLKTTDFTTTITITADEISADETYGDPDKTGVVHNLKIIGLLNQLFGIKVTPHLQGSDLDESIKALQKDVANVRKRVPKWLTGQRKVESSRIRINYTHNVAYKEQDFFGIVVDTKLIMGDIGRINEHGKNVKSTFPVYHNIVSPHGLDSYKGKTDQYRVITRLMSDDQIIGSAGAIINKYFGQCFTHDIINSYHQYCGGVEVSVDVTDGDIVDSIIVDSYDVYFLTKEGDVVASIEHVELAVSKDELITQMNAFIQQFTK